MLGKWLPFQPLSQCIPRTLPYCSALVRTTCLNSRKWRGFHLKKAVSICHKPSQQCSITQKWQIYPWMYCINFLPFPNIFLWDVWLLIWAHLPPLQIAPLRVSQASLPTEGLCGDGGLGNWRGHCQRGCPHGDRADHLHCHGKPSHSQAYQTVIYFSPSATGCHVLSQGHQCPIPPDSSHQRKELRNSAVINNCIYPPGLIFSLRF